MKSPIPILRIFDETKAKEFYQGFLGFTINWEHRFGDDFPLYMQITREACVIHLSEHHGDSSPGSVLRIDVSTLDEYIAELRAKDYKYSKPGEPKMMPWGMREITIGDPFGNRLIFHSPAEEREANK